MSLRNRLISALLATGSLCFGQNPKIALDLKHAEGTVDVIVQFKTAPTSRHHDKVKQKGGSLQVDLSSIKAGHYSIPANAIEDLANDPEVAYISPNRQTSALLDYATPTVYADIAHKYGYDGSGVGIAVIDSGLQTRPGFFLCLRSY